METNKDLAPFLDARGRFKSWPVKEKLQRDAIASLATRFEPWRKYSEREVNDILLDWHTFGDWARLRRLLYAWGYFDRSPDGSSYWLENEHPDADRPDA
jgi:hypothetical protein